MGLKKLLLSVIVLAVTLPGFAENKIRMNDNWKWIPLECGF